MSSLFNLKIDIDKSTEDKIFLSIRATNNEDQKNPKTKKFYFTVIGDIYYYLKTNKFGYGAYIIQKGSTKFIEIPIFEKYCSHLSDYLKTKNNSLKLLSNFEYNSEIENLFDIEILEEFENKFEDEDFEEDEDEIKCANAKLVLSSKNKEVFLPLKNISEIDIYFDVSYL